MEEKEFRGTCTAEELIRFSIKAVWLYTQGGIPENMVAIHLLRKNGIIIGIANLEETKIIIDPRLNLIFYPVDKLKKRSWSVCRFGAKMKITFTKADEDIFEFVAVPRDNNPVSKHKQALNKMGLETGCFEN